MDKIFWVTLVLNIFLFTFLTTSFYLLFSPTALSPPIKEERFWNLTIIHTNDVHSRYDQINSAATDCTKIQFEAGKCYGGTARHKTLIDRLRSESKNSLLLDAGDQFQGTMFFTYYGGEVNSKVLNLLGYNVTAIGNHEFDKGPDVLAAHHSRLTMPIVCANINTTLNPTFRKNIKPYHIFKEYDLAVIGYITDTTGGISNAGSTLSFYDPIPIVQYYVNQLREKGIKRILTISHNGYGPDKELAAKTYGVAVHIGGHSHSLLANDTTLPDYDLALGPYPTVIRNALGEDTLIVQAFWSGKYIGHLDVSFDKKGRVVNYTGGPILVDQSIPQDPEVQKLVKQWREPFDKYVKMVIGEAEDDYDQLNCQRGECTMGNLITDAMLESRNNSDVHAAFMNAGGIRAGLLKGNITRENVVTVLPFDNSLVEIKMTGQNVTDMLESVVSRWENKLSRKKITNLSKTYKLLTNEFVSNTGDGILPYPIETVPLGNVEVAVEDYIKSQYIIKPYLDGRIEDYSLIHEEIKPIDINEPIHFRYQL
ncbi:10956_t:CDS:2 [Funneliformis geosporum]|uniref:1657_t:CDS:1 n=1 Tax=Funneliformis geosporum TaxID=1117311 RepID=A0A9W4SLN2_9GLOM|nr:10956_t:CDS:2 [Funneliformis geosporum]CAI2172932.1 1657_t:CDS:2 [Funneliformis geosporum]